MKSLPPSNDASRHSVSEDISTGEPQKLPDAESEAIAPDEPNMVAYSYSSDTPPSDKVPAKQKINERPRRPRKSMPATDLYHPDKKWGRKIDACTYTGLSLTVLNEVLNENPEMRVHHQRAVMIDWQVFLLYISKLRSSI